MKSFFFVPIGKLDKLTQIRQLSPEEIIIDFEDAAIKNGRAEGLRNLVKVDRYEELWIRSPIRDRWEEPIDPDFLNALVNAGLKRFVLPKLRTSGEWVEVARVLGSTTGVEVILLFEHPSAIVRMIDFFDVHVPVSLIGAGLGSHDLQAVVGGEHTLKNLAYPRSVLLFHCIAFGVMAIDIASMNVGDEVSFQEEVSDGVRRGFKAKFVIHPRQLELLRTEIATEHTVDWAQKVMESLPDGVSDDDIVPFLLDGLVIERPHIYTARRILKEARHDTE